MDGDVRIVISSCSLFLCLWSFCLRSEKTVISPLEPAGEAAYEKPGRGDPLPGLLYRESSGFVKLNFLCHLTNLTRMVVDQDSPGVRMAAAGFSSHLVLPFSGLGRLFQGSMQRNFGMPGLLQIST